MLHAVIHTCEGGSVVKSSLLMDFLAAQYSAVSTCHCEVLVIRGKQFHFSQVVAPGYVGCGTEIHVQKNDKPHSGDIIPCYGGTTVSGLRDGSTLRITLMKHSSPFDVHYCYRLDISNVFDQYFCCLSQVKSKLGRNWLTGAGEDLQLFFTSNLKNETIKKFIDD